MSERPIDHLRCALAVLRRDGGRSALLVADGFDDYLAHAAEGLTLEMALGLAPMPGKRKWWRSEARARRDAILRQIHAGAFSQLSLRQAGREISRLGRRRSAAAPTRGASGRLVELVDEALATGLRFPGERQTRAILGAQL